MKDEVVSERKRKIDIRYVQIGIIHTPYKIIENMPIQPRGAIGIKGKAEIYEEYQPALKDLNGFSHIYLIYHMHKSKGWKPLVVPFLDDTQRGLFSTRAPKRLNPIGISVVKLNKVYKNMLEVENIDILDGTPLLDIKSYAPQFDEFEILSIGWLSKNVDMVKDQRSDARFK